MSYSPVPTVTTSDLWTAGQHNTYCRGNSQQSIPYVIQSAGDMAYANTANSIARLAFMPNSVMISGNNYPEWKQYADSKYKAFIVSIGGGDISNYYRLIGDHTFVGSGGQSISNITETAVTYEYSYLGDEFGAWTASDPTKITIPSNFPSGRYYRIFGYFHTPGGFMQSGMTRMRFRKNGSSYFGGNMESGGGLSVVYHLSAIEVVKLDPGDYIQMMAYHNNGSTMQIYQRRLSIFMVC